MQKTGIWFFLFFEFEFDVQFFFHAIIKSIRKIYVPRIFIDFSLKDIYGSLVENHTRKKKKLLLVNGNRV